jgi:HNH endonuclease
MEQRIDLFTGDVVVEPFLRDEDDQLPCGLSFNELKEEVEVDIYEGWAKRKNDAHRNAKIGDKLPRYTRLKGHCIYLHQIIWCFANNGKWPSEIDHIDGNRKNNSINNLREVTRSQNQMNKKFSKYNTSGITGVSWRKDRHKWEAKIKINSKNIHLGLFRNFDDAVKARHSGEDRYFSQYSRRVSRCDHYNYSKLIPRRSTLTLRGPDLFA